MLAKSPYLDRKDQETVMKAIDRRRPAVLPPKPESLDRDAVSLRLFYGGFVAG